MKTNIVFFGTPEFAVPALTALLNADFCNVSLVVTQPDKPIGRHHSKPVPSPVKRIAQKAGIDILTPRHLGARVLTSDRIFVNSKLDSIASELCSSLQNDNIQLGILVAYGEIIPKKIIDAFPLGILNIHPSLLPKYRGSSPIQAAILNQDRETGVTLIKLDDHMDHGPIVAQKRVKLNMTETAGELHDTLTVLGAQLLIKTVPDYIAGRIKPKPQNDAEASYTEKLTKEDGHIDWSNPADQIAAHVRAMNPWPGAWMEWKGKKLIIWSIAKDGTPKEVQLEGKKRMLFGEFKRGHPDFRIAESTH